MYRPNELLNWIETKSINEVQTVSDGSNGIDYWSAYTMYAQKSKKNWKLYIVRLNMTQY